MRIPQKGFSLVEVLISLLILGLGIVIVFNLFPLALQSFGYSRKLNEVSLFAQKKLEELKSNKQIAIGNTQGSQNGYNWTISVSPIKLEKDVEVLHVQLDTEYFFQNRTQTQRFVTYLEKK